MPVLAQTSQFGVTQFYKGEKSKKGQLQMSFSILKFPPCLLASAIECEAVARLSGRALKLEESPDVANLSLGRSLKLK